MSRFQTFLSVVFWGLFFLPVVLSYFGPAPYATAKPPRSTNTSAESSEVEYYPDGGVTERVPQHDTQHKTHERKRINTDGQQLGYGVILDPRSLQQVLSKVVILIKMVI